jgi:hypothetical protein
MRAKQQVVTKASSDSRAGAGMKTVMQQADRAIQRCGPKKTGVTSVIAPNGHGIFNQWSRFYKI